MKHLLPDHQRHGSHDRSAAARKGKSASPWHRGMNWLSGGGCKGKRTRTAAKRERIAQERYPGALVRPAIRLADED